MVPADVLRDDGDAGVNRRRFLIAGAAGAVALTAGDAFSSLVPHAAASAARTQTPLPSSSIPKYQTALPTFAGRRVSAASFTTTLTEFAQQVLPSSMYPAGVAGTWLWGYQVDGRPAGWPGVSVEARQGTTTTVTYVNNLPSKATGSKVQPLLAVDQTLHWADPLNQMGARSPYAGSVPAVTHLHGAEVPSRYDGAPEAWYTRDGRHGKGYATAAAAAPNAAVYEYPNTQPASTLWFHDHALGITRLNVFSGLAAFYLLRDQYDTGAANNPLRLPAGAYEIELMIQDRLFDTNGQLRFPDGSNTSADLNGPPTNQLTHPFWIPEFFGDAMVVNGRTWPVLKVEPRRYRFRFVDSCNARFLSMNLTDKANAASTTPPSAVSFWQIGTDGGLLDVPVELNDPASPDALKLFLAPAERADVIIDFTGLSGRSLILTNDGIYPYPSGGPPDPALDGQIMRIDVSLPLAGRDLSYNPATDGPLRGGAGQPARIVRLAQPKTGTVAAGVRVDARRQLVIFEQDTVACAVDSASNGPMIDLVNNSKWKGMRDGTDIPIPGSKLDTFGQGFYMTELPRLGATEMWEFLDTTPDSHPLHIHLVQFQILNRQIVDATNYVNAWADAFPGGTFAGQNCDGTFGEVSYPSGEIIPGYGPPADYLTPNADGALGGNPAFGPFLTGDVVPPDPNEAGWKDTVKILPGAVTRVLVRWAPVNVAVGGVAAGQNLYSFDPTTGPGYAWHCHILDHEDNEMMRPYTPVN
ncbi:MAG TPA: multicopper oxidase domain-containing protein [Actinospica sp.]|nr:multicopper oxidase domain-containing protein [Actinospica sp.]